MSFIHTNKPSIFHFVDALRFGMIQLTLSDVLVGKIDLEVAKTWSETDYHGKCRVCKKKGSVREDHYYNEE
jgi:hypothetical protein